MSSISVIIAGASGMVGKGVLFECLASKHVESVVMINRKSLTISHPKLKEIIHDDFFNLDPIIEKLKGYNTLFYCVGITSIGQNEESYSKFTYEMTIEFTKKCLVINPELSMVYCSAAGASTQQNSRQMWANVRGKLENDLQTIGLKSIYSIRPAFIEPLKGVKSRTSSYQTLITIFRPIFFLLRMFPNIATSTVKIGHCMINAMFIGYEKPILESKDINRLAAKHI